MQFYQLLHQRKSDSTAFMRAPVRAFDAVKTLEQTWHFFWWYARPSVAHGQLNRCIGPPQRDLDLTVEGKLESIRDGFRTIFSHISRSM